MCKDYQIYNQDHQNTKTYFNLGCDFFLYTSMFLDKDFSALEMRDTTITIRRTDVGS